MLFWFCSSSVFVEGAAESGGPGGFSSPRGRCGGGKRFWAESDLGRRPTAPRAASKVKSKRRLEPGMDSSAVSGAWQTSTCSSRLNAILSRAEKMMSSTSIHWPEITVSGVLGLASIFVVALLLNRLLRVVTNLVVKVAATQTRAAQVREQQTRTLAGVLYGAGSKMVWVVAVLTALPRIGINPFPALTLAGLACVSIGFGAPKLGHDLFSVFSITLYLQFVVGDSIQ